MCGIIARLLWWSWLCLQTTWIPKIDRKRLVVTIRKRRRSQNHSGGSWEVRLRSAGLKLRGAYRLVAKWFRTLGQSCYPRWTSHQAWMTNRCQNWHLIAANLSRQQRRSSKCSDIHTVERLSLECRGLESLPKDHSTAGNSPDIPICKWDHCCSDQDDSQI